MPGRAAKPPQYRDAAMNRETSKDRTRRQVKPPSSPGRQAWLPPRERVFMLVYIRVHSAHCIIRCTVYKKFYIVSLSVMRKQFLPGLLLNIASTIDLPLADLHNCNDQYADTHLNISCRPTRISTPSIIWLITKFETSAITKYYLFLNKKSIISANRNKEYAYSCTSPVPSSYIPRQACRLLQSEKNQLLNENEDSSNSCSL